VDALNFTKDIAANLPLYDINIRKYNKWEHTKKHLKQ
jgi:hypothetical protein